MKFNTIFLKAFSLLMLLAIQSCGGKDQGQSQDGASTEPPAVYVDTEGLKEVITTSEKPFVLVNFYATWCKPCTIELPELVSLQKEKEGEIKVVLVSIDDEETVFNQLDSFLERFKIDFKTYYNAEGGSGMIMDLYPEWNQSIPLNLIYDNKGNLIEAMGLTTMDEVKMIVNRAKKFETET